MRAHLTRAAELAALLIVLGLVRIFGRRLLIPSPRKDLPMITADPKSPLASKGVWGSIIAVAAVLLPPLLKKAGLDDVIAPQDVIDTVGQVAATLGALLALYGRLTAKRPIG